MYANKLNNYSIIPLKMLLKFHNAQRGELIQQKTSHIERFFCFTL